MDSRNEQPGAFPVSDYEEIVGTTILRELKELASRVKGRAFRHVSAAPEGGGVAEILNSMIPFLRALGVDARWHVIDGSLEFFDVTKRLHNGLQGAPVTLGERERNLYDRVLEHNTGRIPFDGDVTMIHDPQPAGLIAHLRQARPDSVIAWRIHIDTSHADPAVWDFVTSRASGADVALYHMPEFVRPLPCVPVLLQPSVDPLSAKNREMSVEEAGEILRRNCIEDDGTPIIAQVSRFDRFKDPIGVLETFLELRRSGTHARMVYAGSGSVDDPEGAGVYAEMAARHAELSRTDPAIARDIRVIMTRHDPLLVNALQRRAAVMLQLSTREGFGLTAAEAMWKGTPVVARPAGGLCSQVIEGQTGFLVRSPREAAERCRYLIENPAQRARMGILAREHVRQHFLLTRHVRDYLVLMQPEFKETANRLNGHTRSIEEIYQVMRRPSSTLRRAA